MGYAVGKWHCGYAYEGLLPTSRGFDHFFGFYQGAIHYGNMKYIDIKFGDSDHYDFWDDAEQFNILPDDVDAQPNTMYLYRDKIVGYIEEEALKQQKGDLNPFYMYIPLQTIHGPLDRVHEYEDQCDEILGGNVARRSKYCQNMLLTDDVIGTIINTLKDNELWENTLFVLTSDNGADIANKGCNYPLRGTKGTQFDGNTRVIALIGGGAIPSSQMGTQRDALFSSLDWTPTLLHFAGALDKINQIDYSWDGVDQFSYILNGESNENERDHIVFNVGLRNLESATIVFKYAESESGKEHIYKYIAEDAAVDQWTYKRDDGWCVPEENGDWNVIYDADINLAQAVDNKFLFDLSKDIGEKTNLLQLDHEERNDDILAHAKAILTEYTAHPLYSEHLPFLWTRLDIGNPQNQGDGSFVAPFLTQDEYFEQCENGFAKIKELAPKQGDDNDDNADHDKDDDEDADAIVIEPFTEELKGLYFGRWAAPDYLVDAYEAELSVLVKIDHGNVSNWWYIYAIIISLVGLAVYSFVIGRWKYVKKVTGWNANDEYIAIPEDEVEG